MSSLASYKLEYEDLPRKTRKGGKDMKMSKTTNNEAPKASKKYQKTRGEHYKDIVIAVLITGIVAFVAGVQFANGQQATVTEAVQASVSAEAEASK